jgi:hypothetical protein
LITALSYKLLLRYKMTIEGRLARGLKDFKNKWLGKEDSDIRKIKILKMILGDFENHLEEVINNPISRKRRDWILNAIKDLLSIYGIDNTDEELFTMCNRIKMTLYQHRGQNKYQKSVVNFERQI